MRSGEAAAEERKERMGSVAVTTRPGVAVLADMAAASDLGYNHTAMNRGNDGGEICGAAAAMERHRRGGRRRRLIAICEFRVG